MALIAGQRNTLNVDQTLRRLDIGSRIALLDAHQTPFLALMNRIPAQRAVSPKFTNYEDTLQARTDTVPGGALIGDPTITVANGGRFNVEDLVLATATKELMRVTLVAGNVLTVTRAVGSTAAAIGAGAQIYIVGSAAMEGDVSKQARSDTPTKVDNYTQIFRDPVDESGTALSSDFITDPHDWEYSKEKKAKEHASRIERAFWFGRPSENGTPAVRTTGGFFHFQGATNASDAGGSWTESELWTAAPGLFAHGGTRKLAFAGAIPLSVVSQWAQGKVQMRPDDGRYGLNITELQSPLGVLGLIHAPLFDDTVVYTGYMAVLDMDANVKKRYLAGGVGGSRDTHFVDNIQENDRDGKKGEYRSEVGFQIGQPSRHGYIYNITGP
jgi:hypothetical protein